MVKVNIDFWHVLDSNGDPVDAHGLLLPLKSTSATKRLRRRDSEHADYIEIGSTKNDQIFGWVSRVRMSGLPGRFNLKTAKRQALEITDDEGIDEVGYFLYDAEAQTMVTQRHRLIRPSTIEDLIAETTSKPITLNPVLRKDKWARFEKMESLGSFTLRLRSPAHHPDFSGVMESMSKLLNDAQEVVHAETFELKLGAGRTKNASLNPSMLKSMMKRIRAKDDNIESLRVKGREEGKNRQEEIDFIRDRLVFSGNAEYAGRVLEAETCQQILRKAIEEHRAYLKSLL
jgi:hypothetical protein